MTTDQYDFIIIGGGAAAFAAATKANELGLHHRHDQRRTAGRRYLRAGFAAQWRWASINSVLR